MAFTNILIELRLKRGLTVILGDVGTGKTTLSRKLLQELMKRDNMIFHIILNPLFNDERHFLISLMRNFNIESPFHKDLYEMDILELRDAIEEFFIRKSLHGRATVILIIDEAQKLSPTTLETLRILLNFETNEYKLIQLVLLGQVELYPKLMHMPNFLDRISFKYTLNPLGLTETKELIQFRINKAGYKSRMPLFADEAVHEIYSETRGYPRRITMLCHKLLKELIMHNSRVVDRALVRYVQEKEERFGWGNVQMPKEVHYKTTVT